VGDDEDIVQELLQDFAASSQQIGVSMRDAQHAQAAERIRQLSHQLKSAARSVGALRLGQLCEACEAACAQPGQPSSEPLNEVLQELQAVQHQLDNLLQERTS
jgi:two-component system sensor histidine kinase/response regulator